MIYIQKASRATKNHHQIKTKILSLPVSHTLYFELQWAQHEHVLIWISPKSTQFDVKGRSVRVTPGWFFQPINLRVPRMLVRHQVLHHGRYRAWNWTQTTIMSVNVFLWIGTSLYTFIEESTMTAQWMARSSRTSSLVWPWLFGHWSQAW